MGNTSKNVRSSNKPSTSQNNATKLVVDPWFVQLAEFLKTLRLHMDVRGKTSFHPDVWALQSLWPNFMEELNFNERFAIYHDIKNKGTQVLTKLFSIQHLVKYDTFTQSVFEIFQKKVMKNTLNTPLIDGFKYVIGFFIFLQNGPKLPFEHQELEVDNEIDGDHTQFSIYAIIEALNLSLGELADHSIDLDLLVFWVDNLELQDSISIKQFCELPLTNDEIDIAPVCLRTPNDLRRFKERVFHKGPWYTCNALVFTSLSKTPINYDALLKKLLEVKHNRGFEGIKNVQTKEIQIRTYFSGIRTMPEYQITVQRWVFTDLYEADILALYLYDNIENLRKHSASHTKASKTAHQ